jgi:sigma-E factor negative regulatory protein RseB
MLRGALALSLCTVFGVLHAEDGLERLQQMSDAMNTRNYSGTFVYRHKDKVETMRIVRGHTAEGISERLITVSGKPREIIRNNNIVTCVWPEKRTVIVEQAGPGSNFPGLVPEDLTRLSQNYNISVQAETQRIAGRNCLVVDVQPKDEYRYGYRLWIDKKTSLLVRSDLLIENSEPVEQVMFTELSIHDKVPTEALKPEFSTEGFERREIENTQGSSDSETDRWRMERLPPGFILQTRKHRLNKAGNATVEQLIYSDGMATVSVFIEPRQSEKMLHGLKRRGALNVYGKAFNGFQVTVVGEVPGKTVESMAESVTLKD